jgi:putative transposase
MAHTFTNLLFHIIFGTKDRYPFIEAELRPDLHSYVGGIVREIGGTALSIGGMDDHIHILAKLPPVLAVSDALRLVKTNSSKWVREQRGMRSKFAWQSGFAAFSVSESSARSVSRYIERQEAHHRKKTFAEEYIEFLEKNRIPYDPRYVFE